MQKQQLTEDQKAYQALAKKIEPKRPIFKNSAKAFLIGGLICIIGQGIQLFFINYLNFSKEKANNPTVSILIILSVILTSLGVYDKIAQWAGAGTSVPVTGFANTIASSSLEHRSEGYVLGVGGNMFKIAGPVIVFGVFSAFIVAILRILFKSLGVI